MISAFGVEDSRLSKADDDQPASPRRTASAGAQYAAGVVGGGAGGAIAANANRLKDLRPATIVRRARLRPGWTGAMAGAGALGGLLGARSIVRRQKQQS